VKARRSSGNYRSGLEGGRLDRDSGLYSFRPERAWTGGRSAKDLRGGEPAAMQRLAAGASQQEVGGMLKERGAMEPIGDRAGARWGGSQLSGIGMGWDCTLISQILRGLNTK
jgi:hypothetical protein